MAVANRLFDPSKPMSDNVEEFIKRYFELVEGKVVNKRQRKILAYRHAFKETCTGKPDYYVLQLATQLLTKENVKDRMIYLQSINGVEEELDFDWNKSKAEEVLLEIIYDEKAKMADRLKAIDQLNKMKGMDKRVMQEEEASDSVADFMNRLFKK